ncbi:MAG: aldehyde ferredoxin oxidoreductase family protein [Nitrososphaerota archaeon]|nr:aldehyde ferredoxin oxidoreductase family protein [Candidatus Bathyarchaeota archaeon]MDW8024217.1 aldehyde ferredoxin oxidoreductase family protein [Nitrososphaerota archaeon]
MVGGYAGEILWIDLSTERVEKTPLKTELTRKFIGGRGLAAKILFDNLPPKINPLSPENLLIFATGVLTGCPAPGANRTVIVTKSPQTGFFLDTYAGGHLGPEIKFAGYDVIVIKGRAKKPIYMQIEDENVLFKDATHLWGKDCWEAENLIKKEVGEDFKVTVIGPAGENLVKFACVSTDYFHQFGRGGAGAVMGSKNLKGIAIRGSKGLHIANPERLKEYLLDKIEWKFTQGPNAELVKDRIKYGTPLTMDFTQAIGILPTRNFQAGQFEGYYEIDGYAFREKIVVADKSCYSCNTPCVKFSAVKEGAYKGLSLEGPEYETNAMLGSNVGNSKLELIVKANEVCDRLGLDTISAGNVIGFVMECYEKGILTKKDCDGLELNFGNMDAALKLMYKIAYREGIGNILAEGVRYAAQKFNKDSEKFAMHVKGMEYPAYEPRGSPAFALLYAIADRGACHRRGWPVIIESKKYKPGTIEGRPRLAKDLYDNRTILHSIGVCDLPYNVAGIDHSDIVQILSAVTGWSITVEELSTVADRVASLIRAFNVREGARRADDTLAWRTMHEPLSSGPAKGQFISSEMLNSMLDDYYQLRGWDKETGIPLPETLNKLGLEDVRKELEKHGCL